MGKPMPVQVISHPLEVVDALFQQATEGQRKDGSDFGVAAHLEECLRQIDVSKIPSLEISKVDHVAPNSLVRFRGMVQDMYNPEYYVGAYTTKEAPTTWRTTKYRECSEEATGTIAETQLWDRKVYYCVPVPGESTWSRLSRGGTAAVASLASASGASLSSSKRGREDVTSEQQASDGMDAAEPEEGGAKLQHVAREEEEASAGGVELTEASKGGNESGKASYDLNLPVPDETAAPCIVKFYGTEDLRLNDVVDFIGVLCNTPELACLDEGPEDAFMAAEVAATNPPCSQVVRLHAILARPTQVPSPLPPAPRGGVLVPPNLVAQLRPLAPALRQRTLDLLTTALGGDKLAAEYLLLQLVSRVYTRAEPMAVGKLTVNYTCFPSAPPTAQEPGTPMVVPPLSPAAEQLRQVLAAVAPAVVGLPLSVNLLNTSRLAPRKDYDKNILLAGRLQMGAGTALLIDETVMQAGQLVEAGIHNLQALKGLLDSQKVSYDFEYYQMEVEADVAVAILSPGKSLLPSDLVVPLRATAADAAAAAAASCLLPTEHDLEQIRMYLQVARHMEHAIPEDVTKAIEADLVVSRQHDSALSQEDFHRWLTLVRLISLSHGESTMIASRWQEMRQMEQVREERLRVC